MRTFWTHLINRCISFHPQMILNTIERTLDLLTRAIHPPRCVTILQRIDKLPIRLNQTMASLVIDLFLWLQTIVNRQLNLNSVGNARIRRSFDFCCHLGLGGVARRYVGSVWFKWYCLLYFESLWGIFIMRSVWPTIKLIHINMVSDNVN